MEIDGNERLRFGEFEFDSRSGTLFRSDRLVKLQPQPLRVLAVLLERAGQIVSREHLRNHVWGNATFVEFDQGLNYCIRQIRLALREEASQSFYIETLPKQGYRFTAQVTVAGVPGHYVSKEIAEPGGPNQDALGVASIPRETRLPAPSWTIANQPPEIEEIIAKALANEAKDRYQNADDVTTDLRRLREVWKTGSSISSLRNVHTPSRSKGRGLLWKTLAGAFTVGAVGIAWSIWHYGDPPEPAPIRSTIRFLVFPQSNVVLSDFVPAVSPDGQKLAFGGLEPDGKTRLWVRPLSSLAAEPVPGSEGAASVFWSPDSRSVGFFAGGKLKRSDLQGGPPQILCDASDSLRPSGTWNRDGVILFNSEDHRGLYSVPASGGDARPASVLDTSRQEIFHAWPKFLRDGRHFIYLAQSKIPETTGIYVGALGSRASKLLIRTRTNPAYVGLPSGAGYLLLMRGSTLMAQPFDAGRLELQGEAFPVAEQVRLLDSPAAGFAAFSASANGVLAYRTFVQPNTELVWFDRRGRRVGTVGEPGNYSVPALSPDEKRLAVTRVDAQIGTRDLWLFDLARRNPTRFTFDPAEESNPTWSPDGNRIAFMSSAKGNLDIYQKTTTGSGRVEPLIESSEVKIIESWTPDGKFILYDSGGKQFALPLAGDRKPIFLLAVKGAESRSSISPNMKWQAYQSNESGQTEVYVQSFPPSGGQWQISTAGGQEPYWRRDGKELFYLEGTRLMAANVQSNEQIFQAGVPQVLFELHLQVKGLRSRYQVAANGQRFLVNVPLDSNLSDPITVVSNWLAELKR